MPIATPHSAPHPTTLGKMEDRKRPAVSAVDEFAPPSKRQAVNGGSKSKDDSGDMKEEAWIEVSLLDVTCVIATSSLRTKHMHPVPPIPLPAYPSRKCREGVFDCCQHRHVSSEACTSIIANAWLALPSLPDSQARFLHCPSPHCIRHCPACVEHCIPLLPSWDRARGEYFWLTALGFSGISKRCYLPPDAGVQARKTNPRVASPGIGE